MPVKEKRPGKFRKVGEEDSLMYAYMNKDLCELRE